VVQQRVKVIMSPLPAKFAAPNLAEYVSRYEEQFGEIKAPAGVGTVVEKG
jgi:hypothetical protein